MKMVRDYLRFDWLNWRALLLALWGLLAAAVTCAGLVGRETTPSVALSRLETAMQSCWALAGLCALALCLTAGGADSPIAGRSWLLTRPRRARALVTARLLICLAGVALPAAMAHGLSLWLLDFNMASVIAEAAAAFVVGAAVITTVLLWAFVRPSAVGLFFGVVAGGILSAVLLRRGLREWEDWFRDLPPAAVSVILLAVPAVAGLGGAWRRQTRRRWRVNGVKIGVLAAAAVMAVPVAGQLRRRWFSGNLERLIFPDKSSDWVMTLSEPGPGLGQPAQFFPGKATWRVLVKVPEVPGSVELESATILAVAVRAGSDAEWPEWTPARGYLFHQNREQNWMLEFDCDPEQLTAVTDGELRFRVFLRLKRRETNRIPFQADAFAAGEGWTFRVVSVEGAPGWTGGFSCRMLLRTGLFTGPDRPQAEPDWNSGERLLFNYSSNYHRRTDMAGFRSEFRDLRSVPEDRKAAPRPLPEFLTITGASPEERFVRTIVVRGVNVSLPAKDGHQVPVEPAIPRPAVKPPARQRPEYWTPVPWPAGGFPDVPGESAPESDVAVYLDALMYPNRENLRPWRIRAWKPGDQERLAVLAGKWLPLFLEAMVRHSSTQDKPLHALIDGVPDERREEVLRRIPERPDLVTVAMARGWEADAKPYVLRLVEQDGFIRDELDDLCRRYRDPAFHPFMRKWFTANVPTVRSITARGFNNVFADKMLVLIDGRTVYTPLYAGVYWDVQDTMLEDLDRIEVISGPGATQWGANAVNGVINVTTKRAKDTQGGLLVGGAGTELRNSGAARYGGILAPNVYYRVYAKYFERGESVRSNGRGSNDAWRSGQLGFRMDWDAPAGDLLTLQGDGYDGTISQFGPDNIRVNGGNVLGRWSHTLAENSDVKLQLYYDRTHRSIPGSFTQDINTYDLDFQHRGPLGPAQNFVWGIGYRLVEDAVVNTPANAFLPPRVSRQSFSAFAQDEIALRKDRLHLTLGTKIEHNDYTGFEIEPSVRMAWTPEKQQTIWGAVSRAIRTPSRIDRDLFSPATPPYRIAGGGKVVSEKLNAYEIGYRVQLDPQLSLSAATFLNNYDDLRSLEPLNPPLAFPVEASSGLRGRSSGAEFTAEWRATPTWRLRSGWTELRVRSEPQSGSADRGTRDSITRDPNHQAFLRSNWDLSAQWECDADLRYVGPINTQSVSGYFEANLRFGWRPTPAWELSLLGQNLLHSQHAEFNTPGSRRELQRGIYGKASWRF